MHVELLKFDLGRNPVCTNDVKKSSAPGSTFRIGVEGFIRLKAGINLKEVTFLQLVWCGKKVVLNTFLASYTTKFLEQTTRLLREYIKWFSRK